MTTWNIKLNDINVEIYKEDGYKVDSCLLVRQHMTGAEVLTPKDTDDCIDALYDYHQCNDLFSDGDQFSYHGRVFAHVVDHIHVVRVDQEGGAR